MFKSHMTCLLSVSTFNWFVFASLDCSFSTRQHISPWKDYPSVYLCKEKYRQSLLISRHVICKINCCKWSSHAADGQSALRWGNHEHLHASNPSLHFFSGNQSTLWYKHVDVQITRKKCSHYWNSCVTLFLVTSVTPSSPPLFQVHDKREQQQSQRT